MKYVKGLSHGGKKMKKIIAMLITLLLLSFPFGVKAEEIPDIHGQFGVAIDARTGEILYNKNANDQAYPASITKILTAMLLEEHVKDGEMMTASEHAVGQEASNLHFKLTAGEKISKEDAMYALMLLSANDVAMTIAEHIGGSQEEFAKLMNKKAKEIGTKQTNFTSPNGLHDPNHYTTAHDMALITQEALHYPLVMKAMGTKSTTIQTSEKTLEITNPSKIHDNPLALGGKTGYTNAAQNTLVEILQEGNKQVIAVVMKTTLAQEYNDIDIMGKVAFSTMNDYTQVVKKGEVASTQTIEEVDVNYLTAEDVYVETKKDEKPEIQKKIQEYDLEEKEIKAGDVIGEMEVYNHGELVKKVNLVSDAELTITKPITPSTDSNSISILNILISILLPILFYVGFVIFYNYKKQREVKAGQD